MHRYNPNIHHRRSIRLKGYDYSQAGLYFITICCQNRRCRFGTVKNGEMLLNEFGKIAHQEWEKLPERFPNFELDVFQIMPNHMHGIIHLNVGATLAVAPNEPNEPVAPVIPNEPVVVDDTITPNNSVLNNNDIGIGAGVNPAPTAVGDIIGAYKSLVANDCLKIYKSKNEIMGKLWQRNYHEHIIRDEQSYHRIVEYIINNPAKWEQDKFYSK